MKREFTVLKGEFITFNNRSSKALKRESIQNNIHPLPSQHNMGTSVSNLGATTPHSSTRSIRKGSMKRDSVLGYSNSSAVLLNDLTNKENKDTVKQIREGLSKEEGEGLNKIEGDMNDYDK